MWVGHDDLLLTKRSWQEAGCHFHDEVTLTCDLCLAIDPAPCWFSQSKPPLSGGWGWALHGKQPAEHWSPQPTPSRSDSCQQPWELGSGRVPGGLSPQPGETLREGPARPRPDFLIHSNCEMKKVGCVKSFKFRVIFSTAEYTKICIYTHNACIRRTLKGKKKNTSVISQH